MLAMARPPLFSVRSFSERTAHRAGFSRAVSMMCRSFKEVPFFLLPQLRPVQPLRVRPIRMGISRAIYILILYCLGLGNYRTKDCVLWTIYFNSVGPASRTVAEDTGELAG